MIIQVQPKYSFWSGWSCLMRNRKLQLSKDLSFLNGFISVFIDLTSSLFFIFYPLQTIDIPTAQHGDFTLDILYSVLKATAFHDFVISH